MLLICLLAPASTGVAADGKNSQPDGKTQLSAEDRELLEVLDLLEEMDLLETWDPGETPPFPSELAAPPAKDTP